MNLSVFLPAKVSLLYMQAITSLGIASAPFALQMLTLSLIAVLLIAALYLIIYTVSHLLIKKNQSVNLSASSSTSSCSVAKDQDKKQRKSKKTRSTRAPVNANTEPNATEMEEAQLKAVEAEKQAKIDALNAQNEAAQQALDLKIQQEQKKRKSKTPLLSTQERAARPSQAEYLDETSLAASNARLSAAFTALNLRVTPKTQERAEEAERQQAPLRAKQHQDALKLQGQLADIRTPIFKYLREHMEEQRQLAQTLTQNQMPNGNSFMPRLSVWQSSPQDLERLYATMIEELNEKAMPILKLLKESKDFNPSFEMVLRDHDEAMATISFFYQKAHSTLQNQSSIQKSIAQETYRVTPETRTDTRNPDGSGKVTITGTNYSFTPKSSS